MFISKTKISIMTIILGMVALSLLGGAGVSHAAVVGPGQMDLCSTAQYSITVTNLSTTTTACNIDVTVTLPNTYFDYVNSTTLITFSDGSPSQTGDPSGSTPTYVWDLGAYELPPLESFTIVYQIETTCEAVSGDMEVGVVYDECDLPPTIHSEVDAISVEILPGALVITSTPAIVDASVEDVVMWTLEVENTGLGKVKNVEISDVLDIGLAYISSTPAGVESGGTVTWSGTEIPALLELDVGDTVSIDVTATVIACEDLSATATAQWGCAPCYVDGGSAITSVNRLPMKPLLSFTPGNFSIPYCEEGVSHTITINNTGTGKAYDITLSTTFGSALDITASAPATWNAGGSYFTLPDIPGGGSFDLTFTASADDWCSPPSGGSVIYSPHYEDECDNPFFPPIMIGSYSIGTGQANLSVSKSGPAEVEIGGSISYNISVTFSGDLTCGPSMDTTGTVTVIDTYPPEFTVTDSAGGTHDAGNHTLTWEFVPTVTPTTFSRTISLDAPDFTDCDFCYTITTNRIDATVTSCCGCSLADSDTSRTAIECGEVDLITNSEKAAPSPVEKCTDVTITNTYTFNNTPTLDVVLFSDLEFTDDLDGNLEYVSGSVAITIDGSTTATFTTTGTGTGKLVMSDMDNTTSVTGKTLVISYQLSTDNATSPIICSAQTFYSWSSLDLGPNSPTPGCLDDTTVHEVTQITIQPPTMNVGLSGIGTTFDKCATTSITVTLDKTSTSIPPYDVKLFLDTSNYDVTDTSAIICGGDVTFTCTPSEVAGGLLWEFDDTFTAGTTATMTMDIQKRCGGGGTNISATAYYDDLCHDDGTYDENCSGSASDAPLLLLEGSLLLEMSPEIIYATEEQVVWNIYVTNRGSGDAFNVTVTSTLGAGLAYNSSDVTPSTGVTTITNPPSETTWIIDSIDEGERFEITLTVDLENCSNLTNTVEANWGCAGDTCESLHIVVGGIQLPESNMVNTTDTDESFDMCGTHTVTITMKNSGQTHVYDVTTTETLPTGLSYIAGSSQFNVTGSSWGPASDPVISGQNLTWTSTEIASLADLAEEDQVDISFNVKTACGFEGGGEIENQTRYDSPCGQVTTSDVARFDVIADNPVLSATKTRTSPPAGSGIPCGGAATWEIVVSNASGAINADAIWVVDTLDAGFSYSGSTGGVDGGYNGYGGDSQVTTWKIENLAGGASETLTLTATSVASGSSDCLDLNNTVSVFWGCDPTDSSSATPPACTSTLQADDAVSSNREPNITLDASVVPSSVPVCFDGTNTTVFTITITNTSTTASAYDVDAVVTIPDNLYYDGTATIQCEGGSPTSAGPTVVGQTLTFFDISDTSTNLCDVIGTNQSAIIQFGVTSSCYVNDNLDLDVYYYDCCGATQYSDSTTESISSTGDPSLAVTVLNAPYTRNQQVDCDAVGTWNFSVINSGSEAGFIFVEVPLPVDLKFVSASSITTATCTADPYFDVATSTIQWEVSGTNTVTLSLTATYSPPNDDVDNCNRNRRRFRPRAKWGCTTGVFDCTASDTSNQSCDSSFVNSNNYGQVRTSDLFFTELTTTCSNDGSIVVSGIVRNDANNPGGQAVGVTVDLAYTSTATGTVLFADDLAVTPSTINDNSTATFSATTTYLPTGVSYDFTATVNPDRSVCECYYGDDVTTTNNFCGSPVLAIDKTVPEIDRRGIIVSSPDTTTVEDNDIITYRVQVTNNGDTSAYEVTITDVLPVTGPPAFTYVTGSSDATWPNLGGTSTLDPTGTGTAADPLVWDWSGEGGEPRAAIIDPGETLTLEFDVAVSLNVTEAFSYTNSATTSGFDGSGTTLNKPTDDVTLAGADPTIQVSKDIVKAVRANGDVINNPTYAEPGDVLTYEVDISNTGTGVVYQVDFTDTLDPDVYVYDTTGTYAVDYPSDSGTFSISPTTGSFATNITATVYGTAPPGQSPGGSLIANYEVYVPTTVTTPLDNTVTTFAEDGGGVPLPEEIANETILVERPALLIDKTISALVRNGVSGVSAPLEPGDTLIYQVDVTNSSSAIAYDVTVTDVLPSPSSAFTYQAGTSTATWPDLGGSSTLDPTGTGTAVDPLVWDWSGEGGKPRAAIIKNGETLSLTFEVVAGLNITTSTYYNDATTTGKDGDVGDIPPDTDDIDIVGTDPAEFGQTKQVTTLTRRNGDVVASPTWFEPGDIVTYEVTITNEGGASLYDVTITDTLDSDVVFQSGTWSVDSPVQSGSMVGDAGNPEEVTMDSPAEIHGYGQNPPDGGTLSATYLVEVTTSVTTPVDNSAAGHARDGVGRTFDETDTTSRPVRRPSMVISKAVTDIYRPCTGTSIGISGPVEPSDVITYEVTVTNVGDGIAYKVEIEDELDGTPSQFSYLDGTSTAEWGDGTTTTDTRNPTGTPGPSLVWAWEDGGNLEVMLDPNDHLTLQYKIAVGSDVVNGTTYTNTAKVVAEDGDEAPTNEPTDSVGLLAEKPGVSVAKNILSLVRKGITINNPAHSEPGDRILYEITITNTGDGSLYNVNYADSLETGVTLPFDGTYTVQASGLTGDVISDGGTPETLSLDPSTTMLGGEVLTARYYIDVSSTVITPLDNTVSVLGEDCAGTAYTDSAPETIPFYGPTLSFEKTISAVWRPCGSYYLSSTTTVQPGDEIIYTVTVTNTSNAVAYDVTITDTLPADTVFQSGSYSVSDPSYSDNFSGDSGNPEVVTMDTSVTINAGEVLSGTYRVQVTSSVTQGTPLVNDARANGVDGVGTPIGELQDDVSIAVCEPDLGISKIVTQVDRKGTIIPNPTHVEPGDYIQYEVTITNGGCGVLYQVDFQDVMDPDVEYQEGTYQIDTPSVGPLDLGISAGATGTITADLDATISGGGTMTVTYTVFATNGITTPVNNVVNTATGTGEDCLGEVYTDNDGASIETRVPELSIDKQIVSLVRNGATITSPAHAEPGDTITFGVTVTNIGGAIAYNTEFMDVTATWTQFQSGTWSVDSPVQSGSLVGDSGNPEEITMDATVTLNVGSVISATYDMYVTTTVSASLDNTVTTYGEDGGGDPLEEKEDSETIPVERPTLTIIKSISDVIREGVSVLSDGYIEPGDIIVYDVIVTNNSSAIAYDVTVTDELPSPIAEFSYRTGTSSASWPDLGGSSTINPTGTGSAADPLVWDWNGQGGEPRAAILEAGDTLAMSFEVQVGVTTTTGVTYTNEASTTGKDGDVGDIPEVTDDASIPGADNADFAIDKRVVELTRRNGSTISNPPYFEPGDVVTYEITMTNTGGGALYDVTYEDDLENYIVFMDGTYTVQNGGQTGSVITDSGTPETLSLDASLTLYGDATYPPDGDSVIATYRVEVTTSVMTPVDNLVTGDARDGSDTPFEKTSSTTRPVNRPQLALEKIIQDIYRPCISASVPVTGPVEPGDILTYEITVTNTGTGIAYVVYIEDVLPATSSEFSYRTGTSTAIWDGGAITNNNNPTITGGGSTLTWDWTSEGPLEAMLDPNESLTLTFEVDVSSSIENDTTYTNSSTSFGQDGDEASLSQSADTVSVDGGIPGVSVVKNILSLVRKGVTINNPAHTEPGDRILYEITITNTGDGSLYNVNYADSLETGVTLPFDGTFTIQTSGLTGDVISDGGSPETLSLDPSTTILGGEILTARYYIDVSSAVTTPLDNTVSVTGQDCNGASYSDDDSETIPFYGPSLSFEKTISAVWRPCGSYYLSPTTTVEPGDEIIYAVTVTNTSNAVAYDVTITDTLPADTVFQSGSYSVSDPSYSDNFSGDSSNPEVVTMDTSVTINAGEVLSGTYRVQVTSDVTQGVSLVNSARANGVDGIGTPIGELQDDVSVAVCEPDLSLSKEIIQVDRKGTIITNPSHVEPGDYIQYEVTITNDGCGVLYRVDFSDVMDPDVVYQSGEYQIDTPAVGPLDLGISAGATGTITADLDATISGGGTMTVTYTVYATSGVITPVNNVVNTATGTGEDCLGEVYTDNDGASIETREPELSIDKQIVSLVRNGSTIASPAHAEPGDTITYSVTVTNIGGAIAYNVEFMDVTATWTQFQSGTWSVDAPVQSGSLVGDSGNPEEITMDATVTLNVGATISATYDMYVTTTVSASLDNTVTTYGEDGGGDPLEEKTDSETIPVERPTLTIIKSITDVIREGQSALASGYIEPGDIIVYDVIVTNNSSAIAYDVTVTDVLPSPIAEFSYINGTSSASWPDLGGSSTINPTGTGSAADPLVWDWNGQGGEPRAAILEAGDTLAMSFEVQVGVTTTTGVTYTNEASITGKDGDVGDIPEVTDDASIPGADTADFAVSKRVVELDRRNGATISNPTAFEPGDVVTYEITMTNTGGGALYDVNYEDDLENYVVFMDGTYTVQNGGQTGSVVTDSGTPETLSLDASLTLYGDATYPPDGDSVIATYRVEVTTSVMTPVDNLVTGDARDGSDTPFEKTSSTTRPVNRPQLALEKIIQDIYRPCISASVPVTGPVEPGDILTYEITVTNTGTGIAYVVYIEDVLPATSSEFSYRTGTSTAIWDGGAITNNNNPTITGGGSTLTWDWTSEGPLEAMLDPNESLTLTFEVDVSSSIENDTTYTNSSTSFGQDGDEASLSQSADTVSVDGGIPGVSVVKNILSLVRKGVTINNPAHTEPGDRILYEITITNTGDGSLYNVNYADSLETGVTLPFDGTFTIQTSGLTGDVVSDGGTPETLSLDPTTTMLGGEILTARYYIDVSSTVSTPLDNTVSVLGEDCAGATYTDSAPETIPFYGPSLTFEKTVSAVWRPCGSYYLSSTTTVQPGDEIIYTVTVTNTSNAVAYDVTITDTLPADTVFQSGSYSVSDPSYSDNFSGDGGNPEVVTMDTSVTINAGEVLSGTYRVQVTSDVTQGVSLVNSARANGVDGNGTTIGELQDDVTSAVYEPFIHLEKRITYINRQGLSAPLDHIEPGDVVTYELTVTNTGLGIMYDVSVTDDINNDMTFVDGTYSVDDPSQSGSMQESGGIVTMASSVQVNGEGTVSITYRLFAESGVIQPTPHDITNTANTRGEDCAGLELLDTTSTTLPSQEASIEVLKEITDVIRLGGSFGPSGPVEPGDIIVYDVTISNAGIATLHDVEFTDTIAPGTEIYTNQKGMTYPNTYEVSNPSLPTSTLTITPTTTGFCTDISATIYGSGFPGPPSGILTSQYYIYVTSDVTQGVSLDNTVVGDGFDSVTLHYVDEDAATIEVCEPGLALIKVVKAITRNGGAVDVTGPVEPGDIFTYEVTLTNTGCGTLYNTDLTDTLPSGSEYQSTTTLADWPGGTYSADPGISGLVLTWDISATLYGGNPVGEQLVLSYDVMVLSDADSPFINNVTGTGEDGAGTGLEDTGTTTLEVVLPQLAIEKEIASIDDDPSSITTAKIGSSIEYKVTVKNIGSGTAYNVVVTETLPDGFDLVEGNSTTSVGELSPGENQTITFKVEVAQGVGNATGYINTAKINGTDNLGGNPMEASDTAEIEIFTPADKMPIPRSESICCLSIEKEIVKVQRYIDIGAVEQDLYFRTDQAMYASTEMFLLAQTAKTVQPMFNLYQQVLAKAHDYSISNLGNVTNQSGLGIPVWFADRFVLQAQKTGRKPEDVFKTYLDKLAASAGLEETPRIVPLILEYEGAIPAYVQNKASDVLQWDTSLMDKHILPSSLGQTLVRQSYQYDEYRVSSDPLKRFLADLIYLQMEEKVSLIQGYLQHNAIESSLLYTPHRAQVIINRNGDLSFSVSSEESTLYDRASMVWGLSRMRAVLRDANKRIPQALTTVLGNEMKALSTLHYRPDTGTFTDTAQYAENNDDTISLFNAMMTSLALESILTENSDLPAFNDARVMLKSQADYIVSLVKKDNGLFSAYSKNKPVAAQDAKSILGNAAAIRLLVSAGDVSGDAAYYQYAKDLFSFVNEQMWDDNTGYYQEYAGRSICSAFTPDTIGVLLGSLRELRPHVKDNETLERLALVIERIVSQAGLQLDNRSTTTSENWALLPGWGSKDALYKPSLITGVSQTEEFELTNRLAPVMIRQITVEPLLEEAETATQSKNYWSSPDRSLENFNMPSMLLPVVARDEFVTATGMYLSNKLSSAADSLKKFEDMDNPFISDTVHLSYNSLLFEKIADTNLLNLVLLSRAGIPLADDSLNSVLNEDVSHLEQLGLVNPVYLEFSRAWPRFRDQYNEGWDLRGADQTISMTGLTQTMIREIDYSKKIHTVAGLSESSKRALRTVLQEIISKKADFITAVYEKTLSMGLATIPENISVIVDSKQLLLDVEITDTSTSLITQSSILWSLAELTDEATNVSPVFQSAIRYITEELDTNDTITQETEGMLIDMLASVSGSENATGDIQRSLLTLIKNLSDRLVKQQHRSGSFIKKQEQGQFLAEQTAPVMGLIAAYELTGNETYLDTAKKGIQFLEKRLWDEQLGLYRNQLFSRLNTGGRYAKYNYRDIDMATLLSAVTRMMPYFDKNAAHSLLKHTLQFSHRVFEVSGLQQYDALSDKTGDESWLISNASQSINQIAIIAAEDVNGYPGDIITFKITVDNSCPGGTKGVTQDLHMITVRDVLGPDMKLLENSELFRGSWERRAGGRRPVWLVKELSYGDTATLYFQARINPKAARKSVTNEVEASGISGSGRRCEAESGEIVLDLMRFGSLKSTVFIDEDGDGKKDSGEPTVEGVRIVLNQEAGITGKKGVVTFDSLQQGEYLVQLDRGSVKQGVEAVGEISKQVHISEGRTKDITFALVPYKRIEGIVFNDTNTNGRQDPDEQGIAGIALVLRKTGAVVYSAHDGSFRFDHVPGIAETQSTAVELSERQPFASNITAMNLVIKVYTKK